MKAWHLQGGHFPPRAFHVVLPGPGALLGDPAVGSLVVGYILRMSATPWAQMMDKVPLLSRNLRASVASFIAFGVLGQWLWACTWTGPSTSLRSAKIGLCLAPLACGLAVVVSPLELRLPQQVMGCPQGRAAGSSAITAPRPTQTRAPCWGVPGAVWALWPPAPGTALPRQGPGRRGWGPGWALPSPAQGLGGLLPQVSQLQGQTVVLGRRLPSLLGFFGCGVAPHCHGAGSRVLLPRG